MYNREGVSGGEEEGIEVTPTNSTCTHTHSRDVSKVYYCFNILWASSNLKQTLMYALSIDLDR